MILGGLTALYLMPLPASAQSYPIPIGQNGYWRGHIVTGSKFDVRVGDDRTTTQETLEKTFRYDNDLGCTPYAREVIACADADDIEFYRILELLRDGTIFVTYRQGRVHAIAWTSELINSEW
jgi:hypothetical protein